MALLLKVKNSRDFVENLNNLLEKNNTGKDAGASWIIEQFSGSNFYTYYNPKDIHRKKAWFRVCPIENRKSFNEARGTSYNLIFRLQGTKADRMTKELFSFYHSRFLEYLLVNMIEDINEITITASNDDIKELDQFVNYDWR